jgi:anti-sigma B factor antagonist
MYAGGTQADVRCADDTTVVRSTERMRMATILVTNSTHGAWEILAVEGELDLSTSSPFREAVTELVDASSWAAIDLRRVTFMDSTALGVVVAGMKRAREREGELALIGPTGSPRKVLSITALDQIMRIVEDPAELSEIA